MIKISINITALFLCAFISNIYASQYVMVLDKKHYSNYIKIEETEKESFKTPDKNNDLTIIEITDSNHVLGKDWYAFEESTITNFTSFSGADVNKILAAEHTDFAFYNSDNLYVVFNRQLSERSGSNAHGKPYYIVSGADVKVDNNSIGFGNYVHLVSHSSVSGILFSNSTSNPWCSPYHGRYNGGCANNNYRKGNWKLFLRNKIK